MDFVRIFFMSLLVFRRGFNQARPRKRIKWSSVKLSRQSRNGMATSPQPPSGITGRPLAKTIKNAQSCTRGLVCVGECGDAERGRFFIGLESSASRRWPKVVDRVERFDEGEVDATQGRAPLAIRAPIWQVRPRFGDH
jgi:hypothetical protein